MTSWLDVSDADPVLVMLVVRITVADWTFFCNIMHHVLAF